jgi:hypothetical protein
MWRIWYSWYFWSSNNQSNPVLSGRRAARGPHVFAAFCRDACLTNIKEFLRISAIVASATFGFS